MEMRRKDREITDLSEIRQILDRGNVLHLGLMDGRYPYVVPLHYGFEYSQQDNAFIFFVHCAKCGHKIDLIKESPNVFVEMETDMALLSGQEDPLGYTSLFSSFMGRGQAAILTDTDQKIHGLQLLMKHQTGKLFAFSEEMVSGVAILKIVVKDFTAKAKKQ